MSVLLTGGTGTSALATAAHLSQANIPYLVTSRRGLSSSASNPTTLKFDWNDPSTFAPIFDHHHIRAILLIAPQAADVATTMNPFIDLAVQRGVKRFVLVAGGSTKLGGPWTGQVWQHLDSLGPSVEYAVLRPNWFNENFLAPHHVATIRNESRIYSGCGEGRSPLTACAEIGEVAFRALTSEAAPEHDYLICGPKYISYNDVAVCIGAAIGRKVEHVKLGTEENKERLEKAGFDAFNVSLYGRLEEMTRTGEVERLFPASENKMEGVLGRRPMEFREWAEANKAAWL